ncbi:MAG TPA: response regulator [Armatimonadota bacterium]|nr:response regulator [Armatimonadota bacterium]HOS44222.1 response regulator [Armatimonadota bacterium]
MAQRILIIDDEPDIRSLLAVMLTTEGYHVDEVNGGKDGIERLSRESYDLIILDIMMPEMDGWEVCRQIKCHPRAGDTPVLILTVRAQPLDRVIGLEVVQADEYVTKPFTRQHLLAVVNRLLGAPVPEA